jgi:hypothetical protein
MCSIGLPNVRSVNDVLEMVTWILQFNGGCHGIQIAMCPHHHSDLQETEALSVKTISLCFMPVSQYD